VKIKELHANFTGDWRLQELIDLPFHVSLWNLSVHMHGK
jgi:hypothetical protein